MAAAEHPILHVEEFYPPEYKIVELPLIQMPPMDTLQAYACKIYRRVSNGEWKRKCFGRVKFIKN